MLRAKIVHGMHASAKWWIFFLFVAVSFIPATALEGPRAPSLLQGKKLFVDSFDGGAHAAQLRTVLIKRLEKTGEYKIVATAEEADASIRGTGQIWIKGHFTINPRSPATNRQAVFSGFLSVDIVSKSGKPMWSYLVTPSKFAWSNILDDLANNLVKELVLAREEEFPEADNAKDLARTTLTGAGASFPAPLYKKWFESFTREHPEIRIRYEAVGSEVGTQRLADEKLDFAASDVPHSEVTSSPQDGHFQRIASVLGAVVPVYNLKGLNQDLKFTPDTLADIYLGKIIRWNDPKIKASNKGVDLPDAKIVVFHRADGSGTTYAWSDFLSRTDSAWRESLGAQAQIRWPVGIGVALNEGLAAAVEATPNSIGYVELVYAIQHQLSYGSVRNHEGEYVHADLNSLAAAAKNATATAEVQSLSSIVDSPGKDSYPIATFTWLLLPEVTQDPAKKAALIALLRWVLTAGQNECAALGYVPLAREVVTRELDFLEHLK